MSNEKLEFTVEFEVREIVSYTVEAYDVDEAIRKASADMKLDYNDADFIQVY